MHLDEDEERVLHNIQHYGWHGEWVAADKGQPEFVYTVGFPETLGAPEFIVFGLEHKVMHGMLWGVYRQIQAGAAHSAQGTRWPGLIPGLTHDCVSRPVHYSQLPNGHFGRAGWRHVMRGGDIVAFEGVQLFWPSKLEGLLPWEDGCPEVVRDLQPRLDLRETVGQA
jgi:hypothetical protein